MHFPDEPARGPIPQRAFLGTDGKLRPVWRAALFAVSAVLLLVLLTTALRKLLGSVPTFGLAATLFYVAANGALLLLTWLFLSRLDRRSLRTLGLWVYPGWAREALMGVGFGVGLIIVVVGAIVATGRIAYLGVAGGDTRTGLRILGVGGLLLLAAAFEEIAFRGYSFQRLVDALGPFGAILAFATLFGLVHLANPSVTPLSTANTILAGVLLSIAYLKTRALWLPIGLHWSWNFLMGPVFSLPVSGIRVQSMLFQTVSTGPDWLSGGNYGPEGSVVLTAAVVAAIAWLACTRKIAPSPAIENVLK